MKLFCATLLVGNIAFASASIYDHMLRYHNPIDPPEALMTENQAKAMMDPEKRPGDYQRAIANFRTESQAMQQWVGAGGANFLQRHAQTYTPLPAGETFPPAFAKRGTQFILRDGDSFDRESMSSALRSEGMNR